MLTKGDLQNEELLRLRAQFESYVKQHYNIQELTARHELEMRKNQAKISEHLEEITNLQKKLKELKASLKQKNEYIDALEKNNFTKSENQNNMTLEIDNLRRENIDLNSKLSSM